MIDLIVCNPKDVIYPLWMKTIKENRDLFNKVILIMTQKAKDWEFTNYIASEIENSIVKRKFKDDGSDWRNAAINEALRYSESEFVLFLEQDFLMEKGVLKKIVEEGVKHNLLGFYEGERVHPACVMAKKKAMEKTSMDFSVTTDVKDHFGKFVEEMQKFGDWAVLQRLGITGWHHLGGLTQNFRLTKNFYNAPEFYTYLKCSDELPQPNLWREYCKKKLNQVGEQKESETIKNLFKNI